ncbi:MAG: HU family DNA-binding protein [Acidimicrobiales bacterium]|nr:HU family DNA-binding protein [Acidimicrobiales bacterium]
MTKAEVIDAVAADAQVTKADAEKVVNAFFETVLAAAKKGDDVGWPTIGTFKVTKRAARTGRNPRTGEPVKVAASTSLKLQPSAGVRTELNPKRKK